MLYEKRKALGTYLKKRRVMKDLTQTAVARGLGYESCQFISNYERGTCTPSMHNLDVLVTLVDADPEIVITLLLDIKEFELREKLNVKKY